MERCIRCGYTSENLYKECPFCGNSYENNICGYPETVRQSWCHNRKTEMSGDKESSLVNTEEETARVKIHKKPAPSVSMEEYNSEMKDNKGEKSLNLTVLFVCIAFVCLGLWICYRNGLFAQNNEDSHHSPYDNSFQESKADLSTDNAVLLETTEAPTTATVTAADIYQQGDCVTFGSYEQDNNRTNGLETIEWIVIYADTERIVLLSLHCLDCRPMYEKEPTGDINWQNSDLRKWLNGEFMLTAFDESQRDSLVVNEGDAVFLLSAHEVEECLTGTLKDYRSAWATAYAVEQGIGINKDNKHTWWWLRDRGPDPSNFCSVYSWGDLDYKGDPANNWDSGVRPAIILNANTPETLFTARAGAGTVSMPVSPTRPPETKPAPKARVSISVESTYVGIGEFINLIIDFEGIKEDAVVSFSIGFDEQKVDFMDVLPRDITMMKWGTDFKLLAMEDSEAYVVYTAEQAGKVLFSITNVEVKSTEGIMYDIEYMNKDCLVVID